MSGFKSDDQRKAVMAILNKKVVKMPGATSIRRAKIRMKQLYEDLAPFSLPHGHPLHGSEQVRVIKLDQLPSSMVPSVRRKVWQYQTAYKRYRKWYVDNAVKVKYKKAPLDMARMMASDDFTQQHPPQLLYWSRTKK